MTTKYICMRAGCDFLGEDESEARKHAKEHDGHQVVEVALTDSGVICNTLGDAGEELKGEELPEEEFIGEEEGG